MSASECQDDDAPLDMFPKRRKLSREMCATMSQGWTDWATVIAIGSILRRNLSRKRGDDI